MRVLLAVAVSTACVVACGGSNKRGKVVVMDITGPEILDDVRFEADTTTIEPRGQRALDALAATLVNNREILLVEVEVYVGDGPDPQGLADRRAAAVVDELIARKVEPTRLRASGRAETPANPDRPVVFLIMKRAP